MAELEVCRAKPWREYERIGVYERFAALITPEAVIRGGYTVKPHVQRIATALRREFGVTNFGTYGTHSPPEGPTQAIDIFNADNAAGHRIQDQVCEYLRERAREDGVRYVIRREYIWNIERDSEGWRWQGRSGNRTQDHYDHVHLTCYASAKIVVEKPKPIEIGDDVFTYSTHKHVDGGSYWLVVSGKAFRFHLTEDVEKAHKAGIVNMGEMSQSFHNLFEHVG